MCRYMCYNMITTSEKDAFVSHQIFKREQISDIFIPIIFTEEHPVMALLHDDFIKGHQLLNLCPAVNFTNKVLSIQMFYIKFNIYSNLMRVVKLFLFCRSRIQSLKRLINFLEVILLVDQALNIQGGSKGGVLFTHHNNWGWGLTTSQETQQDLRDQGWKGC